MNRFERLAISVLLLCAWSLAAWAQGANPPASTKASGQTSGRGQTAVEQTAKETTLTGCLGGPNDEGVYTLTNDRYKRGVEVGGAKGIDLKPHVGHRVKLTGMLVTSGTAIAGKEKGSGKGEGHFKVTKMDHIATTCTPTEKGKAK